MLEPTLSLHERRAQAITRRHFLRQGQMGLGAVALAALSGKPLTAAPALVSAENPLAERAPHHAPRAKRVIHLHMSGSPPQHDLFDYKPKLVEYHLQPCPESLLANQRFAFIKGRPKLLGTPYKFARHGQSGAELSELWQHLRHEADELAIVKSMWTDQFNHAPAELLLFTGTQRFGGAAMGSWITYGLGSENQDLPGFVVLISGGTDPTGGKALWSSGFLPSVFQGTQCRTGGDPILYAGNPAGMDREVRRRSLDALNDLNQQELETFGDPETLTRISQYELAFRMQMSVPDVMDVGREPAHIIERYGAEPGARSFANNCLLARRLVERGVRYVQLFDWGWDTHGTGEGDDIIHALPRKVNDTDRSIAALLRDLRERGLLEETLVVWSGEFGRTPMNEARGGSTYLGRDHHPHCFTVWLAGAGIRSGQTIGATDELGYFVTEDKTSIHDLQATILHLLGLDPFTFRYPYQGLEQRLIGPTEDPRLVQKLLA
jgi:Protein of unknown function (DUF1501)